VPLTTRTAARPTPGAWIAERCDGPRKTWRGNKKGFLCPPAVCVFQGSKTRASINAKRRGCHPAGPHRPWAPVAAPASKRRLGPAPPRRHRATRFQISQLRAFRLRMGFRRRNRGGRTEPRQSAPAGARRGSGPGGDREIWRAPRGAQEGRDTAVPEAPRKRSSEQLRIIGSPNAVGRHVWR